MAIFMKLLQFSDFFPPQQDQALDLIFTYLKRSFSTAVLQPPICIGGCFWSPNMMLFGLFLHAD